MVSGDAPSRVILDATAGDFSRTLIYETDGNCLAPDECTPEAVAAQFDAISDPAGQKLLEADSEQVMKFLTGAASASGVPLG